MKRAISRLSSRSGALPATVEILEDRTVGPTLAADSIKSSMNASLSP